MDAQLGGRRIREARSAGGRPGSRRRVSRAALGFGCESDFHLFAEFGHDGFVCLSPGEVPGNLHRDDGPERYLRGALVDAVTTDERDRVIRIRLGREDEDGRLTFGVLLFELVQPYFQAVLISERSQRALGVWRGSSKKAGARRVEEGQPYVPISGEERLLPGHDHASVFVSRAEREPRAPLNRFLCRHLAGADAIVSAEILHRSSISAEFEVDDVDGAGLEQLWETASKLYSTAGGCTGGGAFCWSEGGNARFSALRPSYPVDGGIAECSTVSEAVMQVRDSARRDEGAQRQLQRRLESLRRSLKAVEEDLAAAARAEEFERKGSILLAHLKAVPRSTDRVELPDTFAQPLADNSSLASTSGEMVVIELDSRRSPADNAARYLKLAGKFRRRLDILPQRLTSLRAEEYRLQELLARMAAGIAPAEIEELLESIPKETPGPRAERRPEKPLARPRRYRTTSGWIVWAGRNNEENDALTHRMAAAEDIWFHASGYAGSHVVLRREGRRDEPSQNTLHEAAAVAAYWSRGRTAKKVPVVYTKVKYVSKPRGAAPGLAVPQRVTSLIVEPKLLPEQDKRA